MFLQPWVMAVVISGLLADGTVQKLWIPNIICIYKYIFIYTIHTSICIYTSTDPKSTNIQNKSSFFPLQKKCFWTNGGAPFWSFVEFTRESFTDETHQNAKVKDWRLKPIPERKLLVHDVRLPGFCTGKDSHNLHRWPFFWTCIKTILGVLCVTTVATEAIFREKTEDVQFVEWNGSTTCPKTVARINSSKNRVYACAAFAEIQGVSHLARVCPIKVWYSSPSTLTWIRKFGSIPFQSH